MARKTMKRKTGRKPLLTVARAKAALEGSAGIISVAATVLGVHRTTLRRFIDRHPDLEDFIVDVVEQTGDLTEAQLVKLIRQGDPGSIRFYLERRCRDRGYGRSSELSGPGGGPIPIEQKQKMDLTRLTDDELDTLYVLQLKIEGRVPDVVGRHGTPDFAERCDCLTCQRAKRFYAISEQDDSAIPAAQKGH